MVSGIGADLCSIDRIKHALRHEHFRNRVFSQEEISYCEGKNERRYESYAGGFAVREAFSKASGIPLMRVVFSDDFRLIRIDGKPSIKLSGDLVIPSAEIFVSISHEKDYALAFVVIEIKKGE